VDQGQHEWPAWASEFKDRLYGQFARIGKALSSPHRLEILELLAQGERTVDSLATEVGLSLANTSQHLQALRQAALVESSGVKVVVDPKSALYVTGSELDYVDALQGGGFKVKNPNAAASCSCGESFSALHRYARFCSPRCRERY
jgi:iron-sulfur cluster assembly accessory protein